MEEAMAKSELTRREMLALSALGLVAGAPASRTPADLGGS
jgi:hypothetical protein